MKIIKKNSLFIFLTLSFLLSAIFFSIIKENKFNRNASDKELVKTQAFSIRKLKNQITEYHINDSKYGLVKISKSQKLLWKNHKKIQNTFATFKDPAIQSNLSDLDRAMEHLNGETLCLLHNCKNQKTSYSNFILIKDEVLNSNKSFNQNLKRYYNTGNNILSNLELLSYLLTTTFLIVGFIYKTDSPPSVVFSNKNQVFNVRQFLLKIQETYDNLEIDCDERVHTEANPNEVYNKLLQFGLSESQALICEYNPEMITIYLSSKDENLGLEVVNHQFKKIELPLVKNVTRAA